MGQGDPRREYQGQLSPAPERRDDESIFQRSLIAMPSVIYFQGATRPAAFTIFFTVA